jgi:hypothetical protein
MLTPAPSAVASPGEERVARLVGGERDREDGRQGGQRSVDQAVHDRLRPLQQERSLVPPRRAGGPV